MTKENTTEEVDTTEEVVEEAEEKEPVEETEEKETVKEEKEIDYDAIVAEEEKRADPKKAKDAFKKREEKRENEEEEEKPLTRTEMDKMLKDNRTAVRKEFETDRATEIAKANTSSDEEAKAVIALWKTRIVPTGNLEEDVLFALGGLDRKKLISKNGELTRALKSKDGANRNSASTHRDAPEGSEPKLSSADAQAYKSAGFVWDGKKGVYKKTLAKGKFLYKKVGGEQWVA